MRSACRVPIRQSRQHLGMPRRRNAPVPSERPMLPSCPRFTRPRLVAHHGVVAQHVRDRRFLWQQRQFLNRPRLSLPTIWDDGGKLPKLGPVRTARHAAAQPDRRETEGDAAASSIRRCESWLLSVVSAVQPDARRALPNGAGPAPFMLRLSASTSRAGGVTFANGIARIGNRSPQWRASPRLTWMNPERG